MVDRTCLKGWFPVQKKISVWLTLLLAIITCAFGYGAGLDTGSQSSYDSGYETGQADKAAELADYCYTAADLSRQRDAIYQQAFASGESHGYDSGYAAGFAKGKEEGKAEAKASQRSSSSGSSGSSYSSGSSGSSNSSSGTSQNQSVTVYITNTGSKYHRYGCSYLRKSCNAISLSNAKAAGYTPCSRCW